MVEPVDIKSLGKMLHSAATADRAAFRGNVLSAMSTEVYAKLMWNGPLYIQQSIIEGAVEDQVRASLR